MKNWNNPKFITFEGGEGSGKSTQSRKLYEYLVLKGIKVIHTREVGGTKEAEEIRNLLIHQHLYNVSELMLVMAARYEHINKLIVPALRDGYTVICDRFVDSTACYQAGDNLTIEDIFDLHNKLMRASDDHRVVMPDVTFFMDLEPQIGIKRSFQTGDVNKFEDKNMDFHQAVYERFKLIASMYIDRIKVINCRNKEIENIHQEVLSLIN
ncbi:MAG: dTMP kinase [Candidatus Megaira endosymbiont of Carteria cerasiformis]|nr:dTMP kinase [Candidatus Megaera polyxenophila]MCC8460814.1 dTMP kinase [Candidatus Megaera polyxenophila]